MIRNLSDPRDSSGDMKIWTQALITSQWKNYNETNVSLIVRLKSKFFYVQTLCICYVIFIINYILSLVMHILYHTFESYHIHKIVWKWSRTYRVLQFLRNNTEGHIVFIITTVCWETTNNRKFTYLLQIFTILNRNEFQIFVILVINTQMRYVRYGLFYILQLIFR